MQFCIGEDISLDVRIDFSDRTLSLCAPSAVIAIVIASHEKRPVAIQDLCVIIIIIFIIAVINVDMAVAIAVPHADIEGDADLYVQVFQLPDRHSYPHSHDHDDHQAQMNSMVMMIMIMLTMISRQAAASILHASSAICPRVGSSSGGIR